MATWLAGPARAATEDIPQIRLGSPGWSVNFAVAPGGSSPQDQHPRPAALGKLTEPPGPLTVVTDPSPARGYVDAGTDITPEATPDVDLGL